MRVPISSAPGAVSAQEREGIPSLGGYLGLHHAGPLISDVLQRSSYVYLLHPWGRGGEGR